MTTAADEKSAEHDAIDVFVDICLAIVSIAFAVFYPFYWTWKKIKSVRGRRA